MLTDYHVHLRPDEPHTTAERYFTAGNAETYRDAATQRGIDQIGVSEHIYRFQQALSVWRHPLWVQSAVDDIDAYVEFVREETELKLGIEADFVPGAEDRTQNLLEKRDFDYVIGSVHFLAEKAIDMDTYTIWDGASSPEQIWERYFRTLGEAAASGLFDILAHPDLVKVWGSARPDRPLPEGDLRRFYELAIDGIADSGVAIEVSTAGLRKGAGEIYPSPAFLGMCVEAGAPIALSSDAHTPAHIGYRYEEALQLLEEAGVSEICLFSHRERSLQPVGSRVA